MAKYLTNKQTQAALEDIIKKAEKKLMMVSPYVKLTSHWITLIKSSAEKGVLVKFICRKGEVKQPELNSLNSIKNVEIRFIDNLHTKCYFNEKEMIITSFNLLESSEKNWEMGILVNKIDDKEIFEPAMKDIEIMFNDSESTSNINKVINPVNKIINSIRLEPKIKVKTSSKSGYCIRCEDQIKFNIEKPLCRDCYAIWNEWEDNEYLENFCHFSGEYSDGEICFSKPILNKNWKKAKAMYDL